MKKITNITLNKSTIPSSASFVKYKVFGEPEAVFNFYIKDSSSPNKFYNFKTAAFTNTFTSENTLTNVVLGSGAFQGTVKLPASSSGNEYRFFAIAKSHFDSQVNDKTLLLRTDLTQEAGVTVRFTTSTDQATAQFEGVGVFASANQATGSANTSSNTSIELSSVTLVDASDGLALGYKFDFNVDNNVFNELNADLQPVDSDFFTKQSKTTSGTGSSITDMVLTDVNNLVVGMSLVSIASSSVTTSGSLGVLTFPTITAIDTNTNTVTLSSAHSWANSKAVVFRAYGSELIRQSTDGVFEFNNFTVVPKDAAGTVTGAPGTVVVAGDISNSTAVTVDNVAGVSKDSKLVGPGITTTSNANLVAAIPTTGTGSATLTMTGNQTLEDNTVLEVFGSTTFAQVEGRLVIKTFPSLDTDVFFDIDRALILATTS